MKLRLCLCLAATSLVLLVGTAQTARRPRYGGTLRVEIGAAINSLDPAVFAKTPDEASAKEQLDALIYDHRDPDGTFAGDPGSGPFHVAEWEPGKHAMLAANEQYLGGRPFVDSIEIRMGRPARERLLDLEVEKTDFAEIPQNQGRLTAERGVRVSTSLPDELLAIVFLAGRPAAGNPRIREAIARSIDRSAVVNFILQKEGEAATGLLPQWSSGIEFLFATGADTPNAKELLPQIPGSVKITLGYDSGDALEQAVAERIAVNAGEASVLLTVQSTTPGLATSASKLDARLIRFRMPSPHPRTALMSFLAAAGPLGGFDTVPPLPDSATSQQVYELERTLVGDYRVVPLVWLPQVYGLSSRVRDWKPPAAGDNWPLADVWLEGESK